MASNAFWGLLLACFSWPYTASNLSPTPNIDPSWQAALEMAVRSGLPSGTHMVFAYGPLGFLSVWSFYFPTTAVLSFLFLFGFQATLFVVLIGRLRRTAPLVVAIVVAYFAGTVAVALVAVQFTGIPERVLPLFFVGCVALVSRPRDESTSPFMWIALGATLGLFTLVKVSLALPMAVALVIVVLCTTTRHRQAIGQIILGALPVFALGWFSTGNGFTNLYAYARGSFDIVTGYTSALSVEAARQNATSWWALACVVAVGAFAVAHGRGWPGVRKSASDCSASCSYGICSVRGFVRHDSYHDPVFFVSIPLLLVAFTRVSTRWVWLAAGIVATTVVAMLAVGTFPSLVVRPDEGLRNIGHEASVLVSPSQTNLVIGDAKGTMEADYAVPPIMISTIGRHRAVVEPWEQGLIWAYGLTFDPMPAFRDGYTTYLDQLDAHYLASSEAPQFILRQPPLAPDGEDPTFDRPSTQLAMECQYRQVAIGAFWQLLEHVADRCGPAQEIGTSSGALGQWIAVPPTRHGDAVVATFQLPLDLWWQITDSLFKPPEVNIAVNGGSDVYRFVPGTAADLHVLVAPARLGWKPSYAPQHVSRIAFSVGGESLGAAGVKVTFYEVPMSAPQPTPGRR